MKKLPAHNLGAMGEAKFWELCEASGLICNRSNRDFEGWDYIVTFPFSTQEKKGLDEREHPPSAYIQVKTRYGRGPIKLRLTSAEWLAKQPKPAFIYVLEVNDTGQFTGSNLIHISGDVLGKILKRLRTEEALKSDLPNKKYLSFTPDSVGVHLPVESQALRDALETTIGPKLHSYISEKKKQLEELGFEGRPVGLEATFHLTSTEFVDAVLGLKKDIRATNIRSSTTRFGIKLPLDQHDEATINIQPSPADQCSIVVRDPSLENPIVFQGEIFLPAIPGLPREEFKVLIQTEFFQVITSTRDGTSISTKAVDAELTPTDWAKLCGLGIALATRSGTMEVVSRTGRYNLSFDLISDDESRDVEQDRTYLHVFQIASTVLQKAGANEEPKVTTKQIEDNKPQLSILQSLLSNNTAAIELTLAKVTSDNPIHGDQVDVSFISWLRLGKVVIGYSALVKMEVSILGEDVTMKSRSWALKEIRLLHDFPAGYEAFVEKAAANSGTENYWARPAPKS